MNSKNVAILGSTGSIGTQTLQIIENEQDLRVVALSCDKNIDLMEEQIRRFKPDLVCVWDEKRAGELRTRISDTSTRVTRGMGGLIEVATHPKADILVSAIVGMIGIEPTIAAICEKKTIALANKETLVCAGHIIMPLIKECGASLIPVDSEHSAIFQSLQGAVNPIEKIILTASGGPFFGWSRDKLSGVRAEDALKHPNWSMGAKITIDSATLINKGLEVMEACHLFGVGPESIQVVIHRESILHSAVEFKDGAIIGQLGAPDMRVPIAYALFYPHRRAIDSRKISLTDIASLTFQKPDLDTFKGLSLCIDAMNRGGNMPAILNAANEIAVARFLKGEIGFLEIPEYIERAMNEIGFVAEPTVEDIIEVMPRVRGIF